MCCSVLRYSTVHAECARASTFICIKEVDGRMNLAYVCVRVRVRVRVCVAGIRTVLHGKVQQRRK